jgi:Tol biopolymer transport system component
MSAVHAVVDADLTSRYNPARSPLVMLAAGTPLGSYRVLQKLGEGGMGEVYLATDTRLKRQVALKVLPAALTADPDRLARFQREAEVLAALNHPNIAAIHGLEDAEGIRALVMELVEGPTLADRIAHGPIPLDEALPIAKQIAEALEAAHEQGIVHRDLKPANVKVRSDGTVKVLDFGLAKAMEPAFAQGASAGQAHLSMSPTITTPAMTQAGMILGTAAYMSPEQARGRAVDKRADIWAFGCVLFEMLTGRRVFAGDEVTDTLVAVMRDTPDWAALPATMPAQVRRLLERCLERDVKMRLRDIGDARIELAAIPSGTADAAPVAPTRFLARRSPIGPVPVGLVLMGVAVGTMLARWAWPPAPTASPSTEHRMIVSSIEAGPDTPSAFATGFALSPDASTLVYSARGRDGRLRLFRRRLDDPRIEPVPGSEDAQHPFWSPDGREVAFFTDQALKSVPIAGGPGRTIATIPGQFVEGSWGPSGDILFSRILTGSIYRVPATGGQPTRIEIPLGGSSAYPQWLPDGRHFLFTQRDEQANRANGLFVAAVDSKEPPVPVLEFVAGGRFFRYSAAGFVLRQRGGALTQQAFNSKTLALEGTPRPVARAVGSPGGWLALSVAGHTLVALVSPPEDEGGSGAIGVPVSRLQWLDRAGRVVGQLGDEARYWTLSLSRDGMRVAFNAGPDVWTIDTRTGLRTKLTRAFGVVWMPDGREVVHRGQGGRLLWRNAASGEGAPRQIAAFEDRNPVPQDVSPDGKDLLVTLEANDESPTQDLWLVSLADGKARPLVATGADERQARFSPDGRWIAYASNPGGTQEVYARRVDGSGAAVRLSLNGGRHPSWRQDGQEVYFLSPTDEMMAVNTSGLARGEEPGRPQVLFHVVASDNVRLVHTPYAVTADGQRFLLNVPIASDPLTLIQLPRR